ncbi:MAG: hypothetical protein IKS49_06830 [Actinomycetaceae bacterium]|nr:hypothetical protein [Actinomycetaceae bacterium]
MKDFLKIGSPSTQDIALETQEAIDIVKETKKAFALKPMNPFERKVVHDLAASCGIYSDSSGVGDERHVVLLPEPPAAAEANDAVETADSAETPDPVVTALKDFLKIGSPSTNTASLAFILLVFQFIIRYPKTFSFTITVFICDKKIKVCEIFCAKYFSDVFRRYFKKILRSGRYLARIEIDRRLSKRRILTLHLVIGS